MSVPKFFTHIFRCSSKKNRPNKLSLKAPRRQITGSTDASQHSTLVRDNTILSSERIKIELLVEKDRIDTERQSLREQQLSSPLPKIPQGLYKFWCPLTEPKQIVRIRYYYRRRSTLNPIEAKHFPIMRKQKHDCMKRVDQSFGADVGVASRGYLVKGVKHLRNLQSIMFNLSLISITSSLKEAYDLFFGNLRQIKSLRQINFRVDVYQDLSLTELKVFDQVRAMSGLRKIYFDFRSIATDGYFLEDLGHAISHLSRLKTLKLKLSSMQDRMLSRSVMHFIKSLTNVKRLTLLFNSYEALDLYDSQRLWRLLQLKTQLEKLDIGFLSTVLKEGNISDSFSSFMGNSNVTSIGIRSGKWGSQDSAKMLSLCQYLEQRKRPVRAFKFQLTSALGDKFFELERCPIIYQALESIVLLSKLEKLTLGLNMLLPKEALYKIISIINTMLKQLRSLRLELLLPDNDNNHDVIPLLVRQLADSKLRRLNLRVQYYGWERIVLTAFEPYLDKFLQMERCECAFITYRTFTFKEIVKQLCEKALSSPNIHPIVG